MQRIAKLRMALSELSMDKNIYCVTKISYFIFIFFGPMFVVHELYHGFSVFIFCESIPFSNRKDGLQTK